MSRKWLVIAATAALSLGVAACGDDDDNGDGGGDGSFSGEVVIDGSSTVAPLSEAIGVQFSDENSDVRTTVGTSGTGGGFEKFCVGETDISDASRQIEQEEIDICAENGIEYSEVTVANDALTVVINPENPVTCMTVDQLNQIFDPKATITSWGDIEGLDADFSEDLEIFSPGADSGTFDYFTDAINGEEGAQRSKGVNIVGEDDNATVTGVGGSAGGIGYFGYSFYVENQDTLKALEVENPDTGECVAPTEETTQAGDYAPLGRQLYIYPAAESIQREEVAAFVDYYLANVNDVASGIGFIPLTEDQLAESEDQVAKLTG